MTANQIPTVGPLQDGHVIALWPGTPPGSQAGGGGPTIVERSPSWLRPDRVLTGIFSPSLTVVRPDRSSGVSMVVAPGGSYARIVLDKEGYEVAK